jgi:hypothetical protein
MVSALRLNHSPQVIASVVGLCGWALAGVLRVGLRRVGFLPPKPDGPG